VWLGGVAVFASIRRRAGVATCKLTPRRTGAGPGCPGHRRRAARTPPSTECGAPGQPRPRPPLPAFSPRRARCVPAASPLRLTHAVLGGFAGHGECGDTGDFRSFGVVVRTACELSGMRRIAVAA